MTGRKPCKVTKKNNIMSKKIKNMNKNLNEELSKILTYHIDGWYNNEGNKEDMIFEKVNKYKKIKINLCLQSKK